MEGYVGVVVLAADSGPGADGTVQRRAMKDLESVRVCLCYSVVRENDVLDGRQSQENNGRGGESVETVDRGLIGDFVEVGEKDCAFETEKEIKAGIAYSMNGHLHHRTRETLTRMARMMMLESGMWWMLQIMLQIMSEYHHHHSCRDWNDCYNCLKYMRTCKAVYMDELM